jgi:streptogramin lyase
MRALAAALAMLVAAPLAAEAPPAWRAVDAATGQIADAAGLEQLARDFPDSASVRLRLLNAQLQAGDSETALASLRWLAERGHVFSERARAQIPALIGPDYTEAARAALVGTARVIAASTIFGALPAEAGLIESVFVLPGEEGAMASSVSRRSLFALGPDGKWIEVPIPQAQALSGITAAPDGSVGWVASANIDGAAPDPAGFTGLFGLVGSIQDALMIPAPEGVAVSDLTIGPDGRLYASDPIGGGVYRVIPGKTALEALAAPGTFRSPQGLAVSANGKRLYVSDYRYGLAMVDIASGTVTRLASDVPAALDGVDGLWLHGRELIAVQNGTSPMRIIALRLSEDGARITGHRILEQAHPEWTEPLGGSIADGALYYVATGQWDRYDKGRLREGQEAIPTVIRRLPLGAP